MNDKINGKTPEEIKKGLHCIGWDEHECKSCAYTYCEEECSQLVAIDALDYILNLDSECRALLADLNAVCAGKFVDICCICGHYTPDHPREKCELKGLICSWEWRGVQRAEGCIAPGAAAGAEDPEGEHVSEDAGRERAACGHRRGKEETEAHGA